MNDPLSLIYEAHVIKKKDPFQDIYDRIKIINGQKIIKGDVSVFNKKLTKLPNLHDVHVTGWFDCSHNDLTSLEGSPRSVGLNFDCGYNKLISLKGAPKSVDGYFYCINNNITDLEGGPESVGEYFYCDKNPLPKDILKIMNPKEYQEYRKKHNLQKEFGNDIGQTIYDL